MIELTARLTLQSCVSQLTDFFSTDIMATIIDGGYQRIVIRLCEESGEVLPYMIELQPNMADGTHFNLESLGVMVLVADGANPDYPFNIRFTARIDKTGDRTSLVYKCALHIAGDYIKFNEKGK